MLTWRYLAFGWLPWVRLLSLPMILIGAAMMAWGLSVTERYNVKTYLIDAPCALTTAPLKVTAPAPVPMRLCPFRCALDLAKASAGHTKKWPPQNPFIHESCCGFLQGDYQLCLFMRNGVSDLGLNWLIEEGISAVYGYNGSPWLRPMVSRFGPDQARCWR